MDLDRGLVEAADPHARERGEVVEEEVIEVGVEGGQVGAADHDIDKQKHPGSPDVWFLVLSLNVESRVAIVGS